MNLFVSPHRLLCLPLIAVLAATGSAASAAGPPRPNPSGGSPLFQAETPSLAVVFLGQHAPLPLWAAAIAAPAPQAKRQIVSVKQEEKDPNHCSVTDGNSCSAYGQDNGSKCSVFKPVDGAVCSTEEKFDQAACSAFNQDTFCSVFSKAKGGSCSVYSPLRRESFCSVWCELDRGFIACSAEGDDSDRQNPNFCSVSDGGHDGSGGGFSFCSVEKSNSKGGQCSAWGDAGNNKCSTQNPGTGSRCSVAKGTTGVCTTRSVMGKRECSAINSSGGTVTCSTVDRSNGGTEGPNGKGQCHGK